jgi:hypothetical protein
MNRVLMRVKILKRLRLLSSLRKNPKECLKSKTDYWRRKGSNFLICRKSKRRFRKLKKKLLMRCKKSKRML